MIYPGELAKMSHNTNNTNAQLDIKDFDQAPVNNQKSIRKWTLQEPMNST